MAGLGEMLGFGDNPLYQAFNSNRNAISSAFANMGADPLNPWAGWGQGFQRGALVDAAEAEKAQEQAQLNQTTEWLKANYPQFAGLPPAQGFDAAMKLMGQNGGAGDNLMSVGGHLYDTSTGQWISPPQTAENRQNVSLTPQWGQDEQGNWVMLQPSSTGELVQSAVPEGVTLVNPFDLNANKSAGTAVGKQVGGAQFDLPAAQLMADQTLAAIEDVRNNAAGMDEQFGNILGVPQQMTPAWPGTAKANFQVAVGRLTNRAFLEAREMLRGGGQITDFESRKAESAITSLEDAMARGDKVLFNKALNDFEQAVKDGLAKLQQQAATMPGYGGQQPAPSGGGFTILGVE